MTGIVVRDVRGYNAAIGAAAGTANAALPAWTMDRYTSNTTPVSLPATNNLVLVAAQGTPAALTVNLTASPVDGWLQCVKDEANNFAVNNVTVKTTDGSTIDLVAGATGYVMNQTKQFVTFQYVAANTNWIVR